MSDREMTNDPTRLRWTKISKAEWDVLERTSQPYGSILGIPVWTSRYAPPGDVTLFWYESAEPKVTLEETLDWWRTHAR